MNNFLDFWNNLETKVEKFFNFSKGKLPFKILKYYLYLLLSFASTVFFIETFSLVIASHELRMVALYFMWLLLAIIIILPGGILLLIDKILNLNLLSNYGESFLEQCNINIVVESDRE